MAVETFTYKGIRYTSNIYGSYINDKDNCYLKYKPKETIIVDGYPSKSDDIYDNVELFTDMEYYWDGSRAIYNESDSYSSDITFLFKDDVLIEDIKNDLSMPGAKLLFYSTEGTKLENVNINEDGYYIDLNYQEASNSAIALPDISNFVIPLNCRTFQGWRIGDPKTGVLIQPNQTINFNDYPVDYPCNEIKLFAEWADDNNYQFKIQYYANGQLFAEETKNYGDYWSRLTLNTEPTRNDGYVFMGWRIGTTDSIHAAGYRSVIVPYDNSSQIYCKRATDLILSAVWLGTNDTYYKRYKIDLNGGTQGWAYGVCELEDKFIVKDKLKWMLPTLNGPSVDNPYEAFSKGGAPYRHGYSFNGWKSLNTGNILAWDNETEIDLDATPPSFEVQWKEADVIAPLKETEAINVSFYRDSTLNIQYGTSRSYSYTPSFTAKYAFSIPSTDIPMGTFHVLRVTDSSGQVLTFDNINTTYICSVKELNLGDYAYVDTNLYYLTLKKNETYYIEFYVGIVQGNDQSYFQIKNEGAVTKQVTVDPNGGEYQYRDADNYYQITTSSTSKTFTTYLEESHVKISKADKDDITPGDYHVPETAYTYRYYCGIPTKNHYDFNQWTTIPLSTSLEVPQIVLYDEDYPDYYATAYMPEDNFEVKAKWIPDKYYIKQEGNGHTSGHMSAVELEYDIEESLYSNHYQKTTEITFIPRGGVYVPEEWLENTWNHMTIPQGQTEKMILNHSFLGWSDEDGESNSVNEIYNNPIKIDELSSLEPHETKSIYAVWDINKPSLPTITQPGYQFMGWFMKDEDGNEIQITNETDTLNMPSVTLYAHWDPIGLVMINTSEGWKKAAPYVYTNGEWKRTLTNIYTNSEWQLGTNLGQNATDEQLEFL